MLGKMFIKIKVSSKKGNLESSLIYEPCHLFELTTCHQNLWFSLTFFRENFNFIDFKLPDFHILFIGIFSPVLSVTACISFFIGGTCCRFLKKLDLCLMLNNFVVNLICIICSRWRKSWHIIKHSYWQD